MMLPTLAPTPKEELLLERFRKENADLFVKNDTRLFLHLAKIISLYFIFALAAILVPNTFLKVLLDIAAAFLIFCLFNVTIHHHHTHHNAAEGPRARSLLDFLYLFAMPNAPKRKNRYLRAHLNHHARPFHETDVDHHHGLKRFVAMKKNPLTLFFYFLELTFIGGYVPGWEDDRYLNQVPLEEWNQRDYEKVKKIEEEKSLEMAILQWGGFAISLWLLSVSRAHGWSFLFWGLSIFAWGWALPMLLVKNWAHYLGQFQHYDERFLDPSRSILQRTKIYPFPALLNDLAGGEISAHFLHHLFPELPYYRVEEARQRLLRDPEFIEQFVIY